MAGKHIPFYPSQIFLSIFLCLLVVGCTRFCSALLAKEASQALSDENRMAIIRGVSSEYARARITLPRGEKALVIDKNGNYSENNLKALLMKYGPAVDAGQELQITRIEFRAQEILFEINGGGKKKRKWSDHVQVGVGGAPMPVSRPGASGFPTGSSLLLRFGERVPNLTPTEVKQLLAHVLNFTLQSAAVNYVDTLPPEFKEAVAKKEARVGMDRDMVLAALGRPERKIREKNREGVDQEQWIYGSPPAKVVFVIFEGDKVISTKEY